MTRELPLFVYGTLLTEGGQGHLLPGRRRPGRVLGHLYRLEAGYPALVVDHGGNWVHGEWLDPVNPKRLRMLDLYEGVDQGLYRRAPVWVQTTTVRFEAWSWVMDTPERRGGVRIPSGRWTRIRRR